MIVTLLVLVIVALASPTHASLREDCSVTGIPSAYDGEIRVAARRYLPQPYKRQWCLLKSQYWVESRLDPAARSPVGAEGIAQIMPDTAADIARRHAIRGSVRHARIGIRAGAAYLSQMIGVWSAPRSAECRLELAWASYNAGAGHIIQAQRKSGGKRCWDGIAPALHHVTGSHAAETLAYVQRIWRTWRRLLGVTIE